jgi:hypothetical protein
MTISEDVFEQEKEVFVSVVEAEFGLLEMKTEGSGGAAVELGKASFGETPKTLDAVDVAFAPDKFVLGMEDAAVVVAIDDEAVIGAPAAGVDDGALEDIALDDGHKVLLGAAAHHRDEDLAAAFAQAEHGGFARRAASASAANPPGSEVGFGEFERSGLAGGLGRWPAAKAIF